MTQRTFGFLIFVNLSQIEGIICTFSIDKCQPITCTITFLFYWHKKIDDGLVIGHINRKKSCDLIQFTHLNGLDDKTSTDNHK